MIQIDESRLALDLLKTNAAFSLTGRDFLQKEHNNYLLLNGSLLVNCGKMVKDEDKITSDPKKAFALKKYGKDAFDSFMYFVYQNEELLKEIAKHLNRFSSKIKYSNIPYLDVCRTYSEKEFKDVLLSYYATYGNRIYNIVKKYFDENRINMDSVQIQNGLAGYFGAIIWLNSGYIFSKLSKYDGVSISNVAHELGHAIDAEMFLFPQQKKIPLFSDMFVEIPSVAYEIGLYDYLKSQNIDYDGGMILRNNRAASLLFSLRRVRESLNGRDLMIYENGVTKDADGKTYNLKRDLVYGLGYDFGFHLSEIRKSSTQEYLRVLNNLMTSRKEMTLEDAIRMTGFSFEDFVTAKHIKKEIKEDCLTLKKKYNLL